MFPAVTSRAPKPFAPAILIIEPGSINDENEL